MPRRNLVVLLVAAALALACTLNVNRYGRILVYAMQQIDRRALERVGDEALFQGAMDGMVGRLDPYSAYVSPSQLEEFQQSLDQKFGGIGIEVALNPQTKQLTVISPLVGAPAYEAGIRAGDQILRIDGKGAQGRSLADSVNRMHGKPGQPVTLTVLHPGEAQPVDITVIRAVIQVETVLGDTRNADGSWDYFLAGADRIGYVRINTFGPRTVQEMEAALKWLTKRKMRGLILDLRNDSGGMLDAAIGVCDLLIDSGVIVTLRDRQGHITESFDATSEGAYRGFPVAVLVNQFSASASEIVAACLQDHHRAVIVGQRTWGKGTIQEVLPLEAGQGVLKLTTASYWRPSNKNIHRGEHAAEKSDWGVQPDKSYEVIVQGKELAELVRNRQRRDVYRPPKEHGQVQGEKPQKPYVDPQLQKALEYIGRESGSAYVAPASRLPS